MNFMGSNWRQGFNEEEKEEGEEEEKMLNMTSTTSRGNLTFSHPSPSSSTLSHDLHNKRQSLGWLENKFCEPKRSQDQDQEQKQDREEDRDGFGDHPKEQMFEKVVTPSDVGKLNRLVIPKQHAERYFPLDSTTNDKGLILNFEDRNGKPWRFRYSYWNSSQSYVMTKGWSRFVKEKKLDAGDIVSFHRGVGEMAKDRLYIDWRRRPILHHDHHTSQVTRFPPPHPHRYFSFTHSNVQQPPYNSYPNNPWRSTPLLLQPQNPQASSPWVQYSHLLQQQNAYLRSTVVSPAGPGPGPGPQQMAIRPGEGGVIEPMVFDSVPLVVQGKATAKRLRLFGVNMECAISDYNDDQEEEDYAIVPPQHSSSPSSSSIFPLQSRVYNAAPLPTMPSSPLLDKGKSSMSLDFDI